MQLGRQCRRGHDWWRAWVYPSRPEGKLECLICKQARWRSYHVRLCDKSEVLYGARVRPWEEKNKARHQEIDRQYRRKRYLIDAGMDPAVFK